MTRQSAKAIGLDSVREGFHRRFGIPKDLQSYIDVRENAKGRLIVSIDVGNLSPHRQQEVIRYYVEHIHQQTFGREETLNLNL